MYIKFCLEYAEYLKGTNIANYVCKGLADLYVMIYRYKYFILQLSSNDCLLMKYWHYHLYMWFSIFLYIFYLILCY